jgi:hypothetical protein
MTITRTLLSARSLCGVAILAAALIWISAEPAKAQIQGNNAVYNSSGNCSTSSPCAGSSAFIDASAFAFPSGTFCSVIYSILQPSAYSAAVIDGGWPGSWGRID